MPEEKQGFLSFDHDHAACVRNALRQAERICDQKAARLTGLRRRVLELIWESHRPVGAYGILKALMKEQRAAPPTVYRALDFLLEQGLVHRIASLNAYVGCGTPQAPHTGLFFVCETCRESAEILNDRVCDALQETASSAGFEVHRQTVEVSGICHRCRKNAVSANPEKRQVLEPAKCE